MLYKYRHHIVRHFPDHYPFWKKVWANIIFFAGGIVIHHRENELTKQDIKDAKQTLRKGDIVLVGGLRKFSCAIIKGPVTHSLIYLGQNHLVHAIADGVEIMPLKDLFCEYDTIAISRLKYPHNKKIKKVINYALSQLGKPYNFDFDNSIDKFYCTELIYYSLKNAKIKIHVPRKPKVLRPINFIGDKFKTVFISHNLKTDKKEKLIYTSD